MARACILATNRLVRTRMLGGVGGVPGNRAPIPIRFVIDYGHLALPLVPSVIVSDQIGHEVANVDSTGQTRIKNCASNG